MIESLDFEIGRLLRSIPDSIREKTIVIFLGDNGTAGNVIQTFPSNRGKTTLYQGGIHVPLIISGKGVTRNKQTEDALINVSDFFSTLMEIATGDGYQPTPLQNSYSFKHLLYQNETENERKYNFMEIGQNSTIENNGYTIRDNQHKLLITENESPQLFDLINDPYETINLLELAPSNDIIQIHTKLSEKLASIYPQITCYDGILNGEESNVDCGGICKICISDTKYTNKKGNYPIVHTGVLSFYDEDGVISTPSTNAFLFGQDAGRIFNFPSYTQYNASMVVDNVTGLMWQKKMEDKMSYQDAQFYADTLTLGGFSDWRIPTIKELYSLIQFTGRVQGEEAITNFIDDEYFDQPLGNTSIGERAIDAQTWSSTHYSGLTMQSDTTIFGVNFVDGRIKGYPKYSKKTKEPNKMYFRMVRGNGTYGQNTFIDNGNGTVSDSATLLMWQKSDNSMALDWMNAIQYCESLELGGYSDWHLPHAKELQSIVDYTRSPDATNSPAIDPIFGTTEISDPEGNSGHYPYFWSTSPHLDGPNPYKNAAYIAFGKALGKMNNTLVDVHGAGSQRSDPKTGDINNYPQYHGPQGDVQMVYNHCRCVRNILHSTDIEQGTKNLKPSIFPNPATELAYIQCSSNNYPLKISIYSSTFQFIENVELLHNNQGITVSNFPSGIYFIEINNSKSHLTTIKLIKQ